MVFLLDILQISKGRILIILFLLNLLRIYFLLLFLFLRLLFLLLLINLLVSITYKTPTSTSCTSIRSHFLHYQVISAFDSLWSLMLVKFVGQIRLWGFDHFVFSTCIKRSTILILLIHRSISPISDSNFFQVNHEFGVCVFLLFEFQLLEFVFEGAAFVLVVYVFEISQRRWTLLPFQTSNLVLFYLFPDFFFLFYVELHWLVI